MEIENQSLKSELAKFTSPHIQNNSTQKLDQGYPGLEANNIVVVVKRANQVLLGISPYSNGECRAERLLKSVIVNKSNGKTLRNINKRIWSAPDSTHDMQIKRIPDWGYFEVIYWTED